MHDQPAVVVMALAAAPLVEAWCAEDSELGKVGELRGRSVIRYTATDDLSNPSTVQGALREIRSRKGTHLHGSIPCTPWTAWQRINLKKAKAGDEGAAHERPSDVPGLRPNIRTSPGVLSSPVAFPFPSNGRATAKDGKKRQCKPCSRI